MLVRGSVDEGVAKVFMEFGIEPVIDESRARCSKCNGELVELRGDERRRVKDLVFEQTYKHYDVFWLCERCNAVYFQGAYWTNMTRYMEKILELMDELRIKTPA